MLLTLVTLNTWKGEGDYPARVSAMGDLLETVDPDIVFLQEVFAVPGTEIDTGVALRRHLGFNSVAAPARRKVRSFQGRRVVSTSGLTILTRFETLAARCMALPSDPADGERIAQIVEIDPGVSSAPRLMVVNLHLSHLRDARTLRQAQFAAAYDAARPVAELPAIFAGNFNDDPDGPWLNEAVGVSGAGLRNGRDALGIDEKSPTLTHPATDERPRCIDHFVSGSGSVRFRKISHHGDASVSDHLAVRAVIEFGQQPD